MVDDRDSPDDLGDEQGKSREGREGLLTTGDMARLTGNTLRTVRFYEEAGILRPAARSAGGHRLFSSRELERLSFITDMRAAGMSLDEIRLLLELKCNADDAKVAACSAIAALDQQIHGLEQKISVLTRLCSELCQARAILQRCKSCSNARLFPDACDECVVVRDEPELPKSMRVLWSVDGAADLD